MVFKRSRWLLLKNPWNLTGDQKERLSTMVRWNTPIVRAYYLKESFPALLGLPAASLRAQLRDAPARVTPSRCASADFVSTAMDHPLVFYPWFSGAPPI